MRKVAVSGLVVAFAVVLAFSGLGDRDERHIRKTFAELVEAAEFSEREDMMKGGIRARMVGGFFAEDVSADVTGLPMSVSSRADLVALVFSLRTRLDGMEIRVGDVLVDVDPDGAKALLAVSARVTVRGLGQQDTMLKEAEFDWRKTEADGWKIAAIRSVEPIQRR